MSHSRDIRTARDAEKLLGGYAAGILMESEKAHLFSAALEHQELFEALADEEALRELLADPVARQHLLTLLSGPEARNPLKLWRRPAVLGLAASLFAMLTTSVVLWQRERPLPSSPVSQSLKEESNPAPARLAAEDATRGKAAAEGATPEHMPSGVPPQAVPPRAPAAQLGTSMTGATGPSSEAQPKQKAEDALDRSGEARQRIPEKPQAAAVVEVIATADAVEKREATRVSAASESLTSLPANRAMAGGATMSPGVAGGAVQTFEKASAAKTLRAPEPLPAPTHLLERLGDGRVRLTVNWTPGHHLYVLKRTDSGTLLLSPLTTSPAKAGALASTFECTLGEKDHVDLYLLPRPVADPSTLPADGRVNGYWKRVL